MEPSLPPSFTFDKPHPVAQTAEAQRLTLAPTSGTSFSGRGRIIFQLPSGQSGVYFNPNNTYFQYTLRSTVATAFTLDGSGYSPIQSIDIYFGSNHVSSVTDVHILGNMLLDHTCSMSDRGTSLTTMGCADMVGNVANQTPRNGRVMAASINATLDVAIPLLGLFGPGMCSKAISLSTLRDDVRIEIVLNPVVSWATGATLVEGNLLMEQVKLQTDIIRLDGAVEQLMLNKIPKNIMSIPATDFLCYTTTIGAGSGAISWNIPCRAKSVQAVYIVLSGESNSTVTTMKASTTFTRAGMTQYSFRVGGYRIPSVPVANTVEMRSELYKSMRVLNSANNPSSVTQAQYEGEAFAVGIGLDAFQHQGIILDGKSLATSSGILFEATLASNNVALTAYAYVVVDSILTVADGLLSYDN
jgi:hypothetical protein